MMLKSSGGRGYLCRIPALGEKTSNFSPFKCVSCRFLINVVFTSGGYAPLLLVYWEFLIIDGYWCLWCVCSASIYIFIWFCFQLSVNMIIILIDFWNVQIDLHFCNKSHLIMLYNSFFFLHCWIWFAYNLLRIFAAMFMRSVGL